MTKKELGLVLLCFLIMMLFVGICGGGFAKTDFEKELKAAQKMGKGCRYCSGTGFGVAYVR